MADRRGISFRDSAITFGFMTAVVAVLTVGLLVLLDPRSQAFWDTKFSDLGMMVRVLVNSLPWVR
jgi:hypothetical protein